jgi:hypothetical protein
VDDNTVKAILDKFKKIMPGVSGGGDGGGALYINNIYRAGKIFL